MRLLADENFPGLVVRTLRSRGHDLVWIREERPGIGDSEVLSMATRQERILLTFDKEDFGELVFRDKQKALLELSYFASCKMHQTEPKLSLRHSKAGQTGQDIFLLLIQTIFVGILCQIDFCFLRERGPEIFIR